MIRNKDSLVDHILCNSGKPLTLLEEALTYKSLIELGYTQTEISKKIGKTQASVSNTLKLADLSKKIQNVIIKGKISSSLALEIAKSCEWDMQKTEEKLENAISTAPQEKKKVTAKNIEMEKPSKFKYISKVVDKMKAENINSNKIEKAEMLIKSTKQNSFYRNLSRNLKKETPFGPAKLFRHILCSLLFHIQDNIRFKS